jgi:hypothetical protein
MGSPEPRDIQLHWLDRGGIIGVLCERYVTGLAVDVRVDAFGLDLCDIGMAILAGVMAGKGNGVRGKLSNGRASIGTVLPKALRNGGGPENDKRNEAQEKDASQTNQMLRILESIQWVPPSGCMRRKSQTGKTMRRTFGGASEKDGTFVLYPQISPSTLTTITGKSDPGHNRAANPTFSRIRA